MTTIETKVNLIAAILLAENDDDFEKAKSGLLDTMSKEAVPKDPEEVVRDMLTEMGSPDHLLGHEYIVESILTCLENKTMINSIAFSLYPTIAAKFDSTASRVERAIRHSVEIIFNRADLEKIKLFFGNTIVPNKGKPTNGEFIARMTNIARNRLK